LLRFVEVLVFINSPEKKPEIFMMIMEDAMFLPEIMLVLLSEIYKNFYVHSFDANQRYSIGT